VDRTSQQFALLLLLLAFYCLPHFVVLALAGYQIAVMPSGKVDEGALLDIIKEVATQPGAYTNIIHQMIMPTVAAITAANANSLTTRGMEKWIFVLPLLTIFVCILNALIFNTRSILPDQDKGVVSQFFIAAASNLAVYVMLLVGLRMAEPTTRGSQ